MSVHLFKLLLKMGDKEQKQTRVRYKNFEQQLNWFDRFKIWVIYLRIGLLFFQICLKKNNQVPIWTLIYWL